MPSNFYDPLDMDEYIPKSYTNSLFSGAPEIDFLGAVQKTQERNLQEEKIAREQESLQREETQQQKIAELFSSGQEVTPVELQKIYLETGDIDNALKNQQLIASKRMDKEKQAREHMNMALKFAKDGDPDFAQAYMDAQGLSDLAVPNFQKIDEKGRKKGGGSGGSSSGGVGKDFYLPEVTEDGVTYQETTLSSKDIEGQKRLKAQGYRSKLLTESEISRLKDEATKKRIAKEKEKEEADSQPGFFERQLQKITGAVNSASKQKTSSKAKPTFQQLRAKGYSEKEIAALQQQGKVR